MEHEAGADHLARPSNQPSDSARQSVFSRPHAGVCRKLPERASTNARCCAASTVRTSIARVTVGDSTGAWGKRFGPRSPHWQNRRL